MKKWFGILSLVSSLCLVLAVGTVRADDTGATITGKVTFEGDAPKRGKVKMDAEPYCNDKHADKEVLKEDVIVNENKTLKNVVVYVDKVAGKFEAPKEPVTLNQEGCQYFPHILCMMLGQKMIVKDSDPLSHNIHGMPKMNNEFNFGQNKVGQENPVDLTAGEIMIKVKCDVHPWMGCYVGVFEHPFFAVSGDDGTFSIKGLPAGEYTLKAWHEKSKTGWSQTVKVGDKETKDVTFAVKAEDLK